MMGKLLSDRIPAKAKGKRINITLHNVFRDVLKYVLRGNADDDNRNVLNVAEQSNHILRLNHSHIHSTIQSLINKLSVGEFCCFNR